jgi:kynurenine formamidase
MSELPNPGELPNYDQLPIAAGKPPHSAWGVWGDDDEVGAINLLTPERVRDAAALVRKGSVFALNWDLERPDPPFYGRGPLRHRVIDQGDGQDDYYDNFYPQQSSQWDGLSHVGHSEYGYYNGRTPADFTGTPGAKNGIEHWARRGIVGRGVLLDAARHFAAKGDPIVPNKTRDLTVTDLQEIAAAQGTELRHADIVLIRTGWMQWYEGLTAEERVEVARVAVAQTMEGPGLEASENMARFLWDSHFAAVAADTSTLEAWPHRFRPGEYLHMDVLALLGIPIGEMWYLDALADDCASDGRYEFLLTSAPLNKVGGIASPPNALAIK